MKEIQKVYLKNSRMSSSENNIAVLTSAKWEYAEENSPVAPWFQNQCLH